MQMLAPSETPDEGQTKATPPVLLLLVSGKQKKMDMLIPEAVLGCVASPIQMLLCEWMLFIIIFIYIYVYNIMCCSDYYPYTLSPIGRLGGKSVWSRSRSCFGLWPQAYLHLY